MNKYELALVVSAKVEDEVRDAVVEKAKGYITRYNGTIKEVEEIPDVSPIGNNSNRKWTLQK